MAVEWAAHHRPWGQDSQVPSGPGARGMGISMTLANTAMLRGLLFKLNWPVRL